MEEFYITDIEDGEVSPKWDDIDLNHQKTTTVLTNISSTNQPCLIIHSKWTVLHNILFERKKNLECTMDILRIH